MLHEQPYYTHLSLNRHERPKVKLNILIYVFIFLFNSKMFEAVKADS